MSFGGQKSKGSEYQRKATSLQQSTLNFFSKTLQTERSEASTIFDAEDVKKSTISLYT
jgi:hypothetical protein